MKLRNLLLPAIAVLAIAPAANAGEIKYAKDLKCNLDLAEMITGEDSPIKELTKELNEAYIEYVNSRLLLRYSKASENVAQSYINRYGSDMGLQALLFMDHAEEDTKKAVLESSQSVVDNMESVKKSIMAQIKFVLERCD